MSNTDPADRVDPGDPPSEQKRWRAVIWGGNKLISTVRRISSSQRHVITLVRLNTPQRIAATGAVAGIVLLFGALTYDGLRRTHALRKAVTETHETLEAASAILQDLTDAETGVRGYLVTNDPDFLAPYHDAVRRTDADISMLRRREERMPIDTIQLDSLTRLISTVTVDLAAAIDHRETEGVHIPFERAELKTGKQMMDGIRELLRRVANRKRVQLDAVTADADAREREVTRIVIGGTFAIVLLALLMNYLLTRYADRQTMAARRLGARNLALRGENDVLSARANEQQDLLTTRLAMATSIARVGVWEWYMDSNTIAWDDTMFEIYGMEPASIIPYEQWANAVSPDDLPAVEDTLRSVIVNRNEGSAEFRMTRRDGSQRIVSAIERVIETTGSNLRMVGVNIDVTERRQVEYELAQGRRDELRFKDEFLSHVSHELRSPLTAIKQFTTILLGGLAGALSDTQRQYQEIVLKNVRQLQAMIDDLLEVTRLESGKLTVEIESVAVADLLVDVFDTVRNTAKEKGVALSCSIPPTLPLAHADPTRLRQILINLLDNAIKFTPDGGEARIEVSHSTEDPHFLLFEVIDTGSGIDPQLNERLFERLFQQTENVQASRKGLGLGLYICKELVTRQGGTIWVKRNARIGSTISFTVPVFSFDKLIAPLLVNGKWPSESTALVVIETRMPRAWRSKEAQDEWVREARASIQSCLISDLDAFLPTLRSGARGELFFVAAFTDEVGAGVLSKRIRTHFERATNLKQPNQTITVSFQMLTRKFHEIGEPADSLISSMAVKLEAAVKSLVSPWEAP